MFTGGNNKLEDYIILLLSQQGFLLVEQLQDKLQEQQITATVQGIYRVLRKLQLQGVVIKEKQSYSLRISWIFEMKRLIEQMESVYLQSSYLESLIPREEKQKQSWQFTKMIKLADFWDQILIAMGKISNAGISCHYSTYPWYNIAHPEHTTIFNKTYATVLQKEYVIYGGRTFLHKYEPLSLKTLPYESRYYAQENEQIEKNPRIHLDIIGDHILTVKLDQKTVDRLETLYNTVQTEEDVFKANLIDFFNEPVKAKVTIQKNQKKAQKYRKKFEKFFGPIRLKT